MASLSPGMMIKIRVVGNHTQTMGCILRRKWGQNQVSNESKCWIHHYLRRRFSWLIMFKQTIHCYGILSITFFGTRVLDACCFLVNPNDLNLNAVVLQFKSKWVGWSVCHSILFCAWHFQPCRPSAEALEKTRKTSVSESVNAWNFAIIMHEAWELCNIKYM